MKLPLYLILIALVFCVIPACSSQSEEYGERAYVEPTSEVIKMDKKLLFMEKCLALKPRAEHKSTDVGRSIGCAMIYNGNSVSMDTLVSVIGNRK